MLSEALQRARHDPLVVVVGAASRLKVRREHDWCSLPLGERALE